MEIFLENTGENRKDKNNAICNLSAICRKQKRRQSGSSLATEVESSLAMRIAKPSAFFAEVTY